MKFAACCKVWEVVIQDYYTTIHQPMGFLHGNVTVKTILGMCLQHLTLDSNLNVITLDWTCRDPGSHTVGAICKYKDE